MLEAPINGHIVLKEYKNEKSNFMSQFPYYVTVIYIKLH